MTNGKFITVEGVEGVGKSTNIAYIAHYLESIGQKVLITREPGGSPIAEAIRHLLLQSSQETLAMESELLLMFAARKQHLATTILPALACGEWVLCDRFVDATYAYQGAGRGLSETFIQSLESFVCREIVPDLTLLLDLDVSEGLARINQRGNLDRIEQESIPFFERVRACYLNRAKKFARFRIINAGEKLEDVQQQIKTALQSI